MMQAPELPPFDYQPQPYRGRSAEEVLRLRRQFLNPGIFLYYKRPLMIVEGKAQYVFDQHGRRYLDALGGIVTISVGHFFFNDTETTEIYTLSLHDALPSRATRRGPP